MKQITTGVYNLFYQHHVNDMYKIRKRKTHMEMSTMTSQPITELGVKSHEELRAFQGVVIHR